MDDCEEELHSERNNDLLLLAGSNVSNELLDVEQQRREFGTLCNKVFIYSGLPDAEKNYLLRVINADKRILV